jgi:hypothetical protein
MTVVTLRPSNGPAVRPGRLAGRRSGSAVRSAAGGMQSAVSLVRPAAMPTRPPMSRAWPAARPVRPARPPVPPGSPARRAGPVGPATSAGPARPAASAGSLRLTKRGRAVVGGLSVAALALVVFLLSLALGGGALASNHGAAGSPYQGMRQVVVQPGQTLWTLAAQAEPGADPRVVIPQIVSANALAGATIFPGEQLWVPR